VRRLRERRGRERRRGRRQHFEDKTTDWKKLLKRV
jgi:hypothetical protein